MPGAPCTMLTMHELAHSQLASAAMTPQSDFIHAAAGCAAKLCTGPHTPMQSIPAMDPTQHSAIVFSMFLLICTLTSCRGFIGFLCRSKNGPAGAQDIPGAATLARIDQSLESRGWSRTPTNSPSIGRQVLDAACLQPHTTAPKNQSRSDLHS